jgi:hypothetical protein
VDHIIEVSGYQQVIIMLRMNLRFLGRRIQHDSKVHQGHQIRWAYSHHRSCVRGKMLHYLFYKHLVVLRLHRVMTVYLSVP